MLTFLSFDIAFELRDQNLQNLKETKLLQKNINLMDQFCQNWYEKFIYLSSGSLLIVYIQELWRSIGAK